MDKKGKWSKLITGFIALRKAFSTRLFHRLGIVSSILLSGFWLFACEPFNPKQIVEPTPSSSERTAHLDSMEYWGFQIGCVDREWMIEEHVQINWQQPWLAITLQGHDYDGISIEMSLEGTVIDRQFFRGLLSSQFVYSDEPRLDYVETNIDTRDTGIFSLKPSGNMGCDMKMRMYVLDQPNNQQ